MNFMIDSIPDTTESWTWIVVNEEMEERNVRGKFYTGSGFLSQYLYTISNYIGFFLQAWLVHETSKINVWLGPMLGQGTQILTTTELRSRKINTQKKTKNYTFTLNPAWWQFKRCVSFMPAWPWLFFFILTNTGYLIFNKILKPNMVLMQKLSS